MHQGVDLATRIDVIHQNATRYWRRLAKAC